MLRRRRRDGAAKNGVATRGTRNSEAVDEVQVLPAGRRAADAAAPDEEEKVKGRRRGTRRGPGRRRALVEEGIV